MKSDHRITKLAQILVQYSTSVKEGDKVILFDEKMGGTVHLAIGTGIPQTGSRNESVIHWDMLKDMRKGDKIYADGSLIYKNVFL